MGRVLRAALAAAVLAIGLAACGEADVATPDDPVLAAGQRLYDQHCASCHGKRGTGSGVGPRLAGVVEERFTVEQHTRIVVEGKGSGMPGWGDRLPPDQIEAIVRYEREVL